MGFFFSFLFCLSFLNENEVVMSWGGECFSPLVVDSESVTCAPGVWQVTAGMLPKSVTDATSPQYWPGLYRKHSWGSWDFKNVPHPEEEVQFRRIKMFTISLLRKLRSWNRVLLVRSRADSLGVWDLLCWWVNIRCYSLSPRRVRAAALSTCFPRSHPHVHTLVQVHGCFQGVLKDSLLSVIER